MNDTRTERQRLASAEWLRTNQALVLADSRIESLRNQKAAIEQSLSMICADIEHATREADFLLSELRDTELRDAEAECALARSESA